VSRKRKRGEVHLSLRLYWGQDDDLISWLEQFDGQPYGVKTQVVKEALRRGLSAGVGQAAAAPPALDLAEVRRVVEAAIASALARFEGQMTGAPGAAPGEDDEAEGLLDALGNSLVLGEQP
jgi:hypothetical protein